MEKKKYTSLTISTSTLKKFNIEKINNDFKSADDFILYLLKK